MNKTNLLAYISIAVILFSFVNLGFKLTGFATTNTGIVNVSVDSTATLNFTNDSINFGSGKVTNNAAGSKLNSEGTITDGDWVAVNDGFTLKNDGNINFSIGIHADKIASDLLGGSAPTFKYKVSDKDTGACVTNSATTYTNFTTSEVQICGQLHFNASIDEIYIDVELFVPSDSTDGTKGTVITITGNY